MERIKTKETIEELYYKRKEEKELIYEKFYFFEKKYRLINNDSKDVEEYHSVNEVTIYFDDDEESIQKLKDIYNEHNFLVFGSHDDYLDYAEKNFKKELVIYYLTAYIYSHKNYFHLKTVPLTATNDIKNDGYVVHNPNNKPIQYTNLFKSQLNKLIFKTEKDYITPKYIFQIYCFEEFVPEAKKIIIKEIDFIINQSIKQINKIKGVYNTNFIEIDYDNKNKVIKSEKIILEE